MKDINLLSKTANEIRKNVVKMIKTYEEFIFFTLLALWTFLKNTMKEEKFFRPCILFAVIFILMGSMKFNEIGREAERGKKQIIIYVKNIKKQYF